MRTCKATIDGNPCERTPLPVHDVCSQHALRIHNAMVRCLQQHGEDYLARELSERFKFTFPGMRGAL